MFSCLYMHGLKQKTCCSLFSIKPLLVQVFRKFQRRNFWRQNITFDPDDPRLQRLRAEVLQREGMMSFDTNSLWYGAYLDMAIKNKDVYKASWGIFFWLHKNIIA